VVTSSQELRLALLGFPGLAAGRAGLHRLPSATITPREIELVQDVIDEVAQSLGTQLNKMEWERWHLFVLGGSSALIPIVLIMMMRPERVVARRLEDEKRRGTG